MKLLLACLTILILLQGVSFAQQSCPDGEELHTISWQPPTTDVLGRELNDLAGYKLYINDITIDVGNVTNYQLCVPITHEVYVTAYDNAGNESTASNKVDKIAPDHPTGCTEQ